MKISIRSIINKKNTIKLLKNPYFWVILGFVLLIIFGQNNIIYLRHLKKEKRDLMESKQHYIREIKQDSINTIKLRTDMDAIEKFGREKYYMKRDNEDIYIIR
ncbi:MAG: septum formation initiator family protein [Bacteroidales bacterium]|jgi:cell division protein FtsB|nr:septum formation initiator family protein [Bacteroidales bacterium]